jgi:hypothetical protein
MAIINPSWYLCVLFAVALVVSSAITIAPGDCAWMRLERGMLSSSGVSAPAGSPGCYGYSNASLWWRRSWS